MQWCFPVYNQQRQLTGEAQLAQMLWPKIINKANASEFCRFLLFVSIFTEQHKVHTENNQENSDIRYFAVYNLV